MWKPIRGYEGLYEVSDEGRVKSLPKSFNDLKLKRVRTYPERLLKPSVLKYGHLRVSLYKEGVKKEFLVHRLVMMNFISECPEGMECLHIDGNPSNNNLTNLRWGTSKENSEDCITHKTIARGKRLPQTKLTEDQVKVIREDSRSSNIIAEEYNLTGSYVRSLKRRETWSWLED